MHGVRTLGKCLKQMCTVHLHYKVDHLTPLKNYFQSSLTLSCYSKLYEFHSSMEHNIFFSECPRWQWK